MPDSIEMKRVDDVLSQFKDPESGRSVTQMNQLRNVSLSGTELSLTLALTTHSAILWEETRTNLEQHVRSHLPELTRVEVQHAVHDRPPTPLGEVGLTAKSVIAVGSGKGGVGKSTIAACLALGLKRAGSQVGLLDADVFGPSVPHLLGLSGQPEQGENKVRPIYKDGMPVMSIGFLVPQDRPVVWRGPMLHSFITQVLRDFDWGQLDYLIIDMPPGTGDVPLSLSQVLPLTGAVVVCTPQDVALLDAVKAIGMFRTVKIPVLGMVENMSGFVCPNCQERFDIFGSGGAHQRAQQLGIPFLGDVPINIGIRINGDAGKTDDNFADTASSSYLQMICYRLVKNLALAAAKDPPKPQLPVLG
jgi:ATP-binding protein involved in chromosome partitioning